MLQTCQKKLFNWDYDIKKSFRPILSHTSSFRVGQKNPYQQWSCSKHSLGYWIYAKKATKTITMILQTSLTTYFSKFSSGLKSGEDTKLTFPSRLRNWTPFLETELCFIRFNSKYVVGEFHFPHGWVKNRKQRQELRWTLLRNLNSLSLGTKCVKRTDHSLRVYRHKYPIEKYFC